jgi:hypothetical protein
MLPIEEGCLAVIINSKVGNNGKEVIVGKYIGILKGYFDKGFYLNPPKKDYWNIDRLINCVTSRGQRLSDTSHISESRLFRIDGGEFKEEEQAEELVLVNQGDR